MAAPKGQTVPADYAARIRRLRARLALTTTRLAELLGVHRNSVERWESGAGPPSSRIWIRLHAGERQGIAGLAAGVSALVENKGEAALAPRHAAAIDLAADPD